MPRLVLFVMFIDLLTLSTHGSAASEDIDTLCRTAEHYSARSAPVGAEYVPGVDVHGKAVASADINESPQSLHNPIIIPIELNLAQRYGLNLPLGIELKPTVADIKIFDDGHIQYNGVDISDQIETVCENRKAEHKKIQSNQTEQHGHESSDPVLSSDKIEGQYPDDKQDRPHYND